jgi:hypothetical protein
MFLVFTNAFLGYFLGNLAIFLMRMGKTVDETRNMEWIPCALEPLFYTVLMIGNGRFWLQADRQGWEMLRDGSGDLGIEAALGLL